MTLGNALLIICYRCQRVATTPFATSFFPSSLREMRQEIRYALKEAGHVSYISDTLHLFLLSHLSVSVINLFIQAAAVIHVLPYS